VGVPAFGVADPDLPAAPTLPLAMADSTLPRLEVTVSVSCGALSLGTIQPRDLIFGVGLMSVSGTEGLSFTLGDGYQDPEMTFTSTPDQINRALDQLHFHSYECLEGFIELSIRVSDRAAGAHAVDTVVREPLVVEYTEPRAILILSRPQQLW
jgi:hypothetical protein